MSDNDDITSVRIVCADYYMYSPTNGFDPCYSEFRGSDVTQVPIIRIFGSTLNGDKICLHVHGVLPYMYIPCEETEKALSDRFAYQIASSLDKAINISLGQANSKTQHIFKVSLVKGIPFYGYHAKEHQFYKIYFFNPPFIKRAASLFENGAICGKIFQAYESHVPYILQFFIDFNLYGMSFIHIPSSFVKYRENEYETIDNNKMILTRTSTTKYEADITADHIINRMSSSCTMLGYQNPGIASIWEDEIARRKKMAGPEIPSVELPKSQERSNILSTESEIFYKEALTNKLTNLNNSLLSVSQVSGIEMKTKEKKFDLTVLLNNSVYPAELSQSNQNILNASLVENHAYKSKNIPQSTTKGNTNVEEVKNLNDTLVDEAMVLNLTQKSNNDETFNQDDYDLLEVMMQLEESEKKNIDTDSLLAPLTQQSKELGSQLQKLSQGVSNATPEKINNNHENIDKDIAISYKNYLDDSDDELLNDFNMTLENLIGISESPSDAKNIPQVDGADEENRTPLKKLNDKKNSKIFENKIKNSPKSPRNRKSQYASLDITIRRTPQRKEKSEMNYVSDDDSNHSSKRILRSKSILKSNPKNEKCVKNGFSSNAKKNLRFHGIVMLEEQETKLATSKETNYKRNIVDIIEYQKGKHRKINTSKFGLKECHVQLKQLDPATIQSKSIINMKSLNHEFENIINNSPSVSVKRLSVEDISEVIIPKTVEDNIDLLMTPKKQNIKSKKYLNYSPHERARQYDLANNFFPLPGPSTINYYENVDIPGYHYKTFSLENNTRANLPIAHNEEENYVNDFHSSEEDLNIQSFYDRTLCCDSPLGYDELSPFAKEQEEILKSTLMSSNNGPTITSRTKNELARITITCSPPSPDNVMESYYKYGISENEFQVPFYGDTSDITTKKEVGQMVLQIKEKNYCEEFVSSVPNILTLAKWRKDKFCNELSNEHKNLNNIKEFLATEKKIVITPHQNPPGSMDAKTWLKARLAISKKKIENVDVEIDSPIKIKREKSKQILDNNPIDDVIVISDNDSDNLCSVNVSTKKEISFKNDPYEKLNSAKSDRNSLSSRLKRISNLTHNSSRQNSKCRLSLRHKFDSIAKPKNYSSIESIGNEALNKSDSKDSVICSIDNKSKTDNYDQSSENISSGLVNELLERNSYVNILNVDNLTDFDISGINCNDTLGFKLNLENLNQAKANIEYNHLITFSLEIHVQTRGELRPDPDIDSIAAIFYAIHNDAPESESNPSNVNGIIINDFLAKNASELKNSGLDINAIHVNTEVELIEKLLELIGFWDPDILIGYEIELQSWGYLIQRSYVLGFNLPSKLSRVPSNKNVNVAKNEEDEGDDLSDFSTELKLRGRICLDAWRLLRHEIALTSYTFENVMYHIFHRRYPLHSYKDLTRLWYNSFTRWIVLEFYLLRVRGTLELLDQLDLIGRTCELAKLFGIQFYEVLSRGSQFRVESMMLRIAKARNLVAVSPSVQQRAHMRAPEYLPLILEPQSRLYVDPVIVLDFQSLYPSMIIGYNYCFSTCLGRVEHLGTSNAFEFGASQLRVSPQSIKKLLEMDLITVSPCGVVFLKTHVREGVLPRLLKEILDTRLMVKQSMKLHKNNNILQRVLHSRQLGLKLIANVTYGYTAANFSGRMPCVEVADSVVSKGRETLERAIKLVENNKNWKVKVVYGDTDSLFVLAKGRTRAEAFKIGEEIVEAVTKENPQPVKLKLEKIYQPCILQTKKRYVGYMYETPDQKEPVYEAKGIETVRRDGCPAVAKILEKTLRILFGTQDVSTIKRYVCRQFMNIMSGRVNMQELIFAKEFRGIKGYKPGACVPALELTRKWKLVDKRAEPRQGERVPFIIANGPPGLPLIRLVRSPHEMLADDGLKINSLYYINKVIIPPLNRCMLLIGVDVNDWFTDLPRKYAIIPSLLNEKPMVTFNDYKKSTISQYFSTTNCAADCGGQTKNGICNNCVQNSQRSAIILSDKISKLDRANLLMLKICQSCCGRFHEINCMSLDCPALYVSNKTSREHKQIEYFYNILNKF